MTLCIAPWVTIYRDQKSRVGSCCEARDFFPSLDSSMSNEEIFASKEHTEFRNQMLRNEWPDSCQNCLDQETRGVTSLRQMFQLLEKQKAIKPQEHFEMQYMDFRPSNLCNFSCKMCSSELSSTHAVIEGDYLPTGIQTMRQPEQHWNGSEVRIANFAGGEPLMLTSTFDILEQLAQDGVHRKVNIITNGSYIKQQSHILDFASAFEDFTITFSIDATDEAHNYWRHRNTWSRVEENLETLLSKQTDRFYISIRTTIGWPTAFAAREVFDRYYARVRNHTVSFINDPECFSVNMFTPERKLVLLEHWRNWPHIQRKLKTIKPFPLGKHQKLLTEAHNKLRRHDLYHGNQFGNVFPEWVDTGYNFVYYT